MLSKDLKGMIFLVQELELTFCLLLTHFLHKCGPSWFSGVDKKQLGGNSYRNRRSGKSQAKQHEEWNRFLGRFNIRHAKTPVIAAKSRVHRLEDIREFKEIQADHWRCQYRQLRTKDIEDQFILMDRSSIQSIHLEVGNKRIFPVLSPLLANYRVKIIHKYYRFCLRNVCPSHPPWSAGC